VIARHVNDGTAVVASPQCEMTVVSGIEEARCVRVIVDR
jgi:hypothetical protein